MRWMVLLVTALVPIASGWADDHAASTVSVQGEGEIAFLPDRARVALTVQERAPALETAQARVAEVTQGVLNLVRQLRIADAQVDSTAAIAQPQYRWDRKSEQQVLTGYMASRTINIELRDLDRLGDLMEGAVKAGVNQVSPPALFSSRARELYREALAAAAADAKANAEVVANALGARISGVVSISTHGAPMIPQPRPVARMAMAADEAAETYQVGEQGHRTTVSVVFSLENSR